MLTKTTHGMEHYHHFDTKYDSAYQHVYQYLLKNHASLFDVNLESFSFPTSVKELNDLKDSPYITYNVTTKTFAIEQDDFSIKFFNHNCDLWFRDGDGDIYITISEIKNDLIDLLKTSSEATD